MIQSTMHADDTLIDADWLRKVATRMVYCWRLPVGDFYIERESAGITNSWEVFEVQDDGSELNFCRVRTQGELLRVIELLKRAAKAA